MARKPAADHCEAEPQGSCTNHQLERIWIHTNPTQPHKTPKGVSPTFCVRHWVELAQDHPAHAQHIYDVLTGGVK